MATTKLTTRTLALRSIAIAALAAGLLFSITAVDRWTGDWAAMLWVCGTLFFPWLAGIAAGGRVSITTGKLLGGAIGLLTVAGPLIVFAATPLAGPPVDDARIIATVFTAVGAINGAMAFPVGIRVRTTRGSG